MRLTVCGAETYVYTGTRALDPELPTVVFVHGAANDHSVWSLQSRYLAHHRRNAIALDLPGHGRSSGEALASIEAQADWIAALVEGLGVNDAALVGHSMGALAVLECAARRPRLARRVALLGPAAPMAVSDVLLDAAQRDVPAAVEMIVAWSHSPASLLGGNPVPGLWMPGGATRLLERSRHGVLATDLAACNDYGGALDAARKVPCPVLVVTGQRDLMAPARTAQPLIDALADKRAVSLPNCGHAMMIEAPDRVLDALAAFL